VNEADGRWTGTWGVAAESGGASFSGRTIRQIVHTGIGGTCARIRISNAFGGTPLTVRDVHIARSGAGSAILPDTDTILTFGGCTGVTIPAGGSGTSDPVVFAVPTLANVTVSFHLPNATSASTCHHQGTQTNYLAPGDVSGATELPDAQTTGSYFFLTNLDVLDPASRGTVVTLGASITDGCASTQNANARWPDRLAARLVGAGAGVGVINAGISGNRLLVDGSGQSAVNRFERDVLGQPGVRWVIFSDDPLNDLGSTSPQPTAAQLIAGIRTLIAAAHRAGIAFVCSTLTPYQGADYWNPSGEAARQAINAWIRGSGDEGCDGVIDQDAATRDPADPTRFLPAYDSGDHLHPNDAGHQAIANAVNLERFITAAREGRKPPESPELSEVRGRLPSTDRKG
jgi:lysophospholipase L1-like esterase